MHKKDEQRQPLFTHDIFNQLSFPQVSPADGPS
jgi:hypothetical protein